MSNELNVREVEEVEASNNDTQSNNQNIVVEDISKTGINSLDHQSITFYTFSISMLALLLTLWLLRRKKRKGV